MDDFCLCWIDIEKRAIYASCGFRFHNLRKHKKTKRVGKLTLQRRVHGKRQSNRLFN